MNFITPSTVPLQLDGWSARNTHGNGRAGHLLLPSVVVLSKRCELAGPALTDRIARVVRRQALPHATEKLVFRTGKFGDDAAVLGAGLLVLESLFEVPALKAPKFLKADSCSHGLPLELPRQQKSQ